MIERLELLIPEQRIRARVAALARDIDADYRARRLSLLVVLKGAAIFAADLMRHIETPFTVDFVSAASYGAGTRSSGAVAFAGLDGLDLAGRDVLARTFSTAAGPARRSSMGCGTRGRRASRCAPCCASRRLPRSICRSLIWGSTSLMISSSATAWTTPSAIAISRPSTASFSM
jgi:hypothetical protein